MGENRKAQELAQQVLHALDALFQTIEGGEGMRVLVDARGVLSGYVQRGVFQADKALTVSTPPLGGVTFARGGQHFTIHDEELEIVREAVNSRKREIRKRERRETLPPKRKR